MFDDIINAFKIGIVFIIILAVIMIIASIVKGKEAAEKEAAKNREREENIRKIKEESKKWDRDIKHHYMCTFFDEYRRLDETGIYKGMVYIKIGNELKTYSFDKKEFYELYRYLDNSLGGGN